MHTVIIVLIAWFSASLVAAVLWCLAKSLSHD